MGFMPFEQFIRHPAIRHYDRGKAYQRAHTISKHIVQLCRHTGNLPRERNGGGMGMATFGWYDIRDSANYFQSTAERYPRNGYVDRPFILSMFYHQLFSEHAQDKGEKHRFEFLHKMQKHRTRISTDENNSQGRHS